MTTLRDLIRPQLVTAKMGDSAQSAFERMYDERFSQLPVIDEKGALCGVVTPESIMYACLRFRCSIDSLRVSAGVTEAPTFEIDDDVFDVLDDLKESYAVLVVDGQKNLVGIVTQYDIVEYFRARAEELFLIEGIELSIRDHIRRSYSDEDGNLAIDELVTAVDELDDANVLRGRFFNALRNYADRTTQAKFDEQAALDAFRAFGVRPKQRELHDLTFEQAKQLLFKRPRWDAYQKVFGVGMRPISELLDRVREARNKLVHFRGSLTDTERKDIRYCADWLSRHPPPEPMPLAGSIRERAPAPAPIVSTEPPRSTMTVEIAPEDEQDLDGGRYSRLAAHLSATRKDRLSLSIDEVEAIAGGTLPPTARRHRAWWANDSVSHSQSRRWLEAGWRVASVNLTTQRVVFARIGGRQHDYIAFFSHLRANLAEIGVKISAQPNGSNWLTIEWVPTEAEGLPIVCAFARESRYRIELYIDYPGGDGGIRTKRNKAIFDALFAQRTSIEGDLGVSLSWERLDHRVAARVALYREGSIVNGEDQLSSLRLWTIEWYPKFRRVLGDLLGPALASVR